MDKILTEAFDKLKAIEESDDPFCIGAKDEDIVETYTEVEEADHPADAFGIARDWDDEEPAPTEAPNAREQPKSYAIETDNGNEYAVHFQSDGGKERAFIEADGITIATYTVGGAGAMNAQIKDAEVVLDALTAALQQSGQSYGR